MIVPVLNYSWFNKIDAYLFRLVVWLFCVRASPHWSSISCQEEVILTWCGQHRESPAHLQIHLCHYVINVLHLLSFLSKLLLLIWSLLEMQNLRLLSNFVNHWGSCGNADSSLIGPGWSPRYSISNKLLGDAYVLSSRPHF